MAKPPENAIGTTTIGPSFGDELRYAGLDTLPIAWGEDGSFAWNGLTQDQQAAVLAVYAKHDPSKPAAPTSVTRVQFAHQAAIAGLATEDEALAWAANGSALPGKVKALVEALPSAQKFPAKMAMCKETFDRFDPTTVALTTAFGWDDEQRGLFWASAAGF